MDKLSYLNIKNISENKAELRFYGEIVNGKWNKWEDTDKCPKDVIDCLEQVKGKDLDIYINSPGGSVFAGIAIYNMLKRHKGYKKVYIDGLAASIASVIAMAGDEILIPKNAFLMIHKPYAGVYGNSEEMLKMAEELENIQNGIVEIYKSKLKNGIDIETIVDLINKETWLIADEAAKYFNVTVLEENKVAAKIDIKSISNYKNVPKDIIIEDKKSNILKLQSEIICI